VNRSWPCYWLRTLQICGNAFGMLPQEAYSLLNVILTPKILQVAQISHSHDMCVPKYSKTRQSSRHLCHAHSFSSLCKSLRLLARASVSNYDPFPCILTFALCKIRITSVHCGTQATVRAARSRNIMFISLLIPVTLISHEERLKTQTKRWP
jgi:hypothetical protein